MRSGELLDERSFTIQAGTPRLVSIRPEKKPAGSSSAGMSRIPASKVVFRVQNPESFIPLGPLAEKREAALDAFEIDTWPVTNAQFKQFIDEARYQPRDTVNFLRHWRNGMCPEGMERHPVVWVSLEDARAYASWAGKRLPSEAEWQLAAQSTDGRLWPWGMRYDSTRCNAGLGTTTPVDAYLSGASIFGVQDLVGNVWQLTDDVYDNGSCSFVMIRGGGHFRPEGSGWYLKGGPQPLDRTQIMLMVSPGFNRSATVGFRCAR
jgi:formylglycine-generating enzyme required for sulfatase activity